MKETVCIGGSVLCLGY